MIATASPVYSDYFVLFGAISLILGIAGYVRAKSLPSLIAGGISGIGLCAAGVIIARNLRFDTSPTGGYLMAMILCLALLGKFLPGFLKTKRLYPAGLMALLSLIGLVIAALGTFGKLP